MKRLLLTLASLVALTSCFCQQNDSVFIRSLGAEILTRGEAYDNLRILTKQIGGRLAGSPQMVKAEQWGLRTLQKYNPDKAWLQECMVPHWIRGGRDEAYIVTNIKSAKNSKSGTPVKRALDVVALGNSIGSRSIVMGNVIEINSFDELEQKKDSVQHKIVFYNYHFDPTYLRTFESYRDAVVYRSTGASRAAKYGAEAVIVRSMSHGANNHPHTGALRYDSAYPMIPAVAIGLEDADFLSSYIKTRNSFVALKTNGHFLPDTIGHNVVAELRGTEFPNEYITIGGHLDSWDNCEGAHDDGAGVVQTVEILRAFQALGYKPKRSIRFVLFANEENGLRGGAKYADEAKAKGEKHIFALESDSGGFSPRGFGFSVSDEQMKKIMGWELLLAMFGAGELTRGGGGADIGPLNRTQQTPVASLVPDSQRYFDLHHARNDVFEAVNKRELHLGALNMAALVYLIDKYGL